MKAVVASKRLNSAEVQRCCLQALKENPADAAPVCMLAGFFVLEGRLEQAKTLIDAVPIADRAQFDRNFAMFLDVSTGDSAKLLAACEEARRGASTAR